MVAAPDRASEATALQAENAQLRERVTTQQQLTASYKSERDALYALVRNPQVSPTRKLALMLTYDFMGCPLGTSPACRRQEDRAITHATIEGCLGISEKQVGKHMADMAADVWVRRTEVKWTDERTGKPRRSYRYAPVEGADFVNTVGNPAQLREGRGPQSKLQQEAEAKPTAKESLARALAKLVRGECPICHTQDCAIHCANDHVTPMAEVPEAKATKAVRRRRFSRHQGKAPPCGDGPAEETSTYNAEDSSLYTYNAEDSSGALQAAVAALAPAVTRHPDAIQMQKRDAAGDPKYLSLHYALKEKHIENHLLGKPQAVFGTSPGYMTEAGQRARAMVFDSDGGYPLLVRASLRLARKGCPSLLVRNPAKSDSGHLWVLVDEEVDPAPAIAALERIAPELREIPERFADGKARVRLPGGCYLPVGGDPVVVDVACVAGETLPDYHPGTSPQGWAAIAAAVTPAAILMTTWVPPEQRPHKPRPKPRPPLVRCPAGRPGDRWSAVTDWAALLEPHGWQLDHHRGDQEFWTRPGKRDGTSATVNYADSGLLYVFSANAAPFEPERGYSKFTAYALLEHAGDFTAAARALVAQGYGAQGQAHKPPAYMEVNHG